MVDEALFTSQVPGSFAFDATGISVGLAMRFIKDGVVKSIKFYAPTTLSGGTYTAQLYLMATQDGGSDDPGTGTGTAVTGASGTFGTLTAGAWNTVTFAAPVAVTKDTVYVAAVFSSVGRYSSSSGILASDLVNGNIVGIAHNSTYASKLVRNGRYNYAASISYPNDHFSSEVYFVDVVYAANATGTPFTKDSVETYRVLNTFTKDSVETYRVLAPFTKNSAETYRVLQGFTKDSAETYRVLSGFIKNSAETYRVLQSFTKDSAETYRVLAPFTKDSVEAYRVLNAFTKDSPEQYRVLQAFTKNSAELYNVQSGTSFVKDSVEQYRVLNSFVKDSPESYRVLQAFTVNSAESYRVLNSWQKDSAETYRVYAAFVRDSVERYTVLSDIPPTPLSADVRAFLTDHTRAILTADRVTARL
jgi:hypothetical protein